MSNDMKKIQQMADAARKKSAKESGKEPSKKSSSNTNLPQNTIRQMVWCPERKMDRDNFRNLKFRLLENQNHTLDAEESYFIEVTADENGNERRKVKNHQKELLENHSNLNIYEADVDPQSNKILAFKNMPYRLAKDSRLFISQDLRAKNFALHINKAGRFEKDKFDYLNPDRSDLFQQFDVRRNYQPVFIARHKESIRQYCKCHNLRTVKPFEPFTKVFTLNWRLAAGLGVESVYETGMTFHPVYGVPYLPASSVKGIVRSYIIADIFENKEEDALNDPGFCRIFGSDEKAVTKAQQGDIIFFDALPEYDSQLKVEADIMNPHYGDFLTVTGAKFSFAFATHKNGNDLITSLKLKTRNAYGREEKREYTTKFLRKTPLQVIEEYLPLALENHGIGAKTAVGYGRIK
jgi:CRISPR-associated protein Cmr6